MDRSTQQDRPRLAPQAAHQEHVFHQLDFRKSAEFAEHFSPHEDSLISIGEPEPADSGRVSRLEQTKSSTVCIDSLTECTRHNSRAFDGSSQFWQRIAMQPSVGVLEQQNIPLGTSGAQVHLCAAARPRNDQLAVHAFDKLRRAISAAAIDDNDFVGPTLDCSFKRLND